MLLALGLLAALATPAVAATSDGQRLADRFAPIVKLKDQEQPPCDTSGEQFIPSPVELVFDRPDIVLRRRAESGEQAPAIPAPTAADLHGRDDRWYLDVPGSPFSPGCTYATDAIRLGQGEPPVAYAHIVTQPDAPGRLALQFWFFYYFNQFNDLHEGDWEMVQLVFAADTPAQALGQEPISVGYSQHDGGERAGWDGDKIEREGTHPVVYPAAGSHANYYSSALWLGRSASEGFGCDDTTGPSTRLAPEARLVREPAGRDDPFAWLAFEGNWGQQARGLFNAPSGPNTNKKWSRPIDWDEGLRGSSIAVPSGGSLGVSVTGFFCDTVAFGSTVYADALDSPWATGIILLVVGATLVASARLTRWSPVEADPIVARRAVGQVVRAARRVYGRHIGPMTRIGLIFVPLSALGSAIQSGLIWTPSLQTASDSDLRIAFPFALLIGGAASLVAYIVMTAATAEAMRQAESGRSIGALPAYRAIAPRWRPLLGALGRAAAIVLLLFVSIVGIPWAVRQALRYAFIPQVCVLEGLGARDCLRRSSELVRGRWWRTAVLVVLLTLAGLVPALILGLALLLTTSLPLPVINFVGSLVYVVALPYVAVAMALAYGDRAARGPVARRRRRRCIGA